MIRISVEKSESHSLISIAGHVTGGDLAELKRLRLSSPTEVVLDLGDLDACSEEGIRFFNDWRERGARVVQANLFLQMLLQRNGVKDEGESARKTKS